MLTPERRAELRGLAESAQPFIRHGGTDTVAVYVPPADLLALLDASDERDRLAGVLAATPVTRSAAAYGWDRAIASLRYEDGTSVEIVTQSNPFASRPSVAARQLRERLGALDGADEQHEGWGR